LAVYHYWQDRQPLNNLNTDWAPARHVINAALNLDFTTKRFHTFHFGVGANNLTSTAYTSFFQFNAPGGRYYNPVAPINGFFRLGWSWAGSRQKQ
ncbi:MAG: hypothetical protein JNM00_11830, partial [Flavobacteriales bacterium]|nr:hypothetical protein [Flavobacteriales bacterium]